MLWSHRELIGTPRNIVDEASLVQDVNLNCFPCQGSTLAYLYLICIHILKETNLILPEAGMKVSSSIEFL